jgi:hypothetical protein
LIIIYGGVWTLWRISKLIFVIIYRYCAKLIHGWGGVMGAANPPEKRPALLQQLDRCSMNDVRACINRLIERGYDRKKPLGYNEQETLSHFEASARMIELLKSEIQPRLEASRQLIGQTKIVVRSLMQEFRTSLAPFLVAINSKTSQQGVNLDTVFDRLFKTMEQSVMNATHTEEEELEGIDSDEEEQLFKELDEMSEARDRLTAFKGPPAKFMAGSFQKAFLNVTNFGSAYELVRIHFGHGLSGWEFVF